MKKLEIKMLNKSPTTKYTKFKSHTKIKIVTSFFHIRDLDVQNKNIKDQKIQKYIQFLLALGNE